MSTTAASKVSFTVRRPTPVSRQGSSGLESDAEGTFKVPALPRHLNEANRSSAGSPLANGSSRPPSRTSAPDSSDEEEEGVGEIITEFDQQRLNGKKDKGPLVIPALANRDWREVARKRKAVEMFVPASGAAKIGADGSVGGLGTTDTINSGPELSGLVKMEKKMKMDVDATEGTVTQEVTASTVVHTETDDQRALRALIAEANGEHDSSNDLVIPSIPLNDGDLFRPKDEADAFRRDVVTRPDQASLEDYERVPVEQFGAALLRGMGWKPGQAASRTRTGPVEPYLPESRPALLGIGAKEKEALDDGSTSKKPTRPERRYVPVIKKEREGSGRDSGRSSRRSSRSPEPERRDRDKDRNRDRDRDSDRRREKDRDYERRRDKDRDYDYDRDYRDRRREYESDRDRTKEKDRRRDKGRDRDYDRERSRR
ncbi:hypothetical protein PNOK_0108400 [Pyrrhoderma noxium]|uniref:G-patch domain-containing protein n=1 Tax=Pyrrhoderma noxium TaxID=2282107 RepID=A0A286UWP3_9AGAM|nr:hypothetical protein PNOK_0108400 [Pyrrhoderma noxium]